MKPIKQSGDADKRVDGLLRTFFQKEMPHPWPAPPFTPETMPAPPSASRSWNGHGVRAAVAASMAALVLGYLALAGWFPRTNALGLPIDPQTTIGSRPGLKSDSIRPEKSPILLPMK